jgi:V/A-type H+-transporting ATPase subunit C
MIGLFKYGDLSTKIRAMKGKMLTHDDYEQMMIKPNVKEVALYLKNNTYYKDALQDLNESDIHRGKLEVMLYRSVVSDALKIAKHLTGTEKRIYRYVYRKLEIEDVKKMLRTLATGKSLQTLDRASLFVSHYSRIDFNKSLAAKNVKELVDTLEGTNFYGLLKPLVSNSEEIDTFAAEMILDLYYFQKTAKQVKKVESKTDQVLLDQLLGVEADFKNIFWIYRAKKYYNLNREMIFRYLIPHKYKLNHKILAELIDTKSIESFINRVEETYYGQIIDFTYERVELQAMSFIYELQERSMRQNPFSIAPIIGYMYLKETEVLNITNIVEGIRYNIGRDNIKDYLAGVK